jgi:RNA polymerase-binding transcription factor DksA
MSNHLKKDFIEERRQQLLKDYADVKKELDMLREDDPFSNPDHVTDNAAIDTDVREQTGHQVIEAENYGYCEKTNKPIPQARLELIPEARYCIEE